MVTQRSLRTTESRMNGVAALLLLWLWTAECIPTHERQPKAAKCPPSHRFGTGPRRPCRPPTDPNNRPPSAIEKWFTKELFDDLFPKANLGWGPDHCWPYSYESFRIAARYFPRFGTEAGRNFSAEENHRRDLAAFFAHAIQETGENDIAFNGRSKSEADDCFYRGGFFNWFEGGPLSSLLTAESKGTQPEDGEECLLAGRYCQESAELSYFYPCGNDSKSNGTFRQCYFGRGAIQLSYNFNYGQFGYWLQGQGINVDLLAEPNLLITKMDPPLAVMASLWFYMIPQPPKPAMHDIVVGNWKAGEKNAADGYSGAVFGPTSLIINNECGGEETEEPGGGGENRRIKAFKWFCEYFGVPAGSQRTLSCKDMPEHFQTMRAHLSYQPDWGNTWKGGKACRCAPAQYSGMIPFYDPKLFPDEFVHMNAVYKRYCEETIYDNPSMYSMNNKTSACLLTPLAAKEEEAETTLAEVSDDSPKDLDNPDESEEMVEKRKRREEEDKEKEESEEEEEKRGSDSNWVRAADDQPGPLIALD